MNITALTALLNSCLPFLMKLGEKAAESASDKIGTEAWNTAKKIWEKLSPKIKEKDDARVAAEQVAAKPESQARKAVFQEELKILLRENPVLAEEIAQIMAESLQNSPTGLLINQAVTGDENQVVGQVSDGQVIRSVTGNVTISE